MAKGESPAREPLAVFDVDVTLLQCTVGAIVSADPPTGERGSLLRARPIGAERKLLRLGSYDTYDRLVIELFLRELKGVLVSRLQRAPGSRWRLTAEGCTSTRAMLPYGAGEPGTSCSHIGLPREILDLFLTPLRFDRSWGTALAQDARPLPRRGDDRCRGHGVPSSLTPRLPPL